MSTHISAATAAKRLNVSRATLYAYVSRGSIRSRAIPGKRSREYALDDIERLAKHKRGRRDPAGVAEQALEFEGLPVLRSELCLIDAGRLYYRGRDAVALSRESRFESVAALLWDGPCSVAGPEPRPSVATRRALAAFHFAAAGQCHLAAVQAGDYRSYDLSPDSVRRTGAKILSELARLAAGFPDASASVSVAEVLCEAWGQRRRPAQQALEAALILCADHELNASAFTARVIASAGATPYMAVIGALGALSGHRHGGATERVMELLDERGDALDLIGERLRRGESLPGFGHPLYPEGDPRAVRLLALCPRSNERSRAAAVENAAWRALGVRPNVDFGLATLSRCMGWPRQAPFILFALGRSAGWIGHAIEQYRSGALIRPRARYIGPAPEGS